jgi:tetratricopeptide (TPR) repeat protein
MRAVIAEAHLRRGLEQGSAADFEHALQLQPRDDRPLRALVGLLIKRGDVQGAQRALARYASTLPGVAEIAAACSGKPPKDGRQKLLHLVAGLSAGDHLPELSAWPAGLRPLGEVAAALLHGRRPPESPAHLWEPPDDLEGLLRTAALLEAGEARASAVGQIKAQVPPLLSNLQRSVVRRLTASLVLRGEASAAEELLHRFPDTFDAKESAALRVRIGTLHYEACEFARAAAALSAARGHYPLDQAIALACEGAGDDAGAIEAWRRALRQEERLLGHEGRAALAKVHLHIARLAWRGEDAHTAAKHFQAGLAVGEPEDPGLLEEYAGCLDELGRADEALDFHLRYLLRVPDDTRTLLELVDDRMCEREYAEALRIIEAVPEIKPGETAEILHSALAGAAIAGLLVEDEPEWIRRAHLQLVRVPGAEALARRTGSIVAARAGRMEEALALLTDAPPLTGGDILLEWSQLIDGVAHLRVGKLDEAEASFLPALEYDRFKVAVAFCLMHQERTGLASCAGSPEGRAVVDILREAADEAPMELLHDAPRRARRCPHFNATLGNLRASVDPEDLFAALHAESERGLGQLIGKYGDIMEDD